MICEVVCYIGYRDTMAERSEALVLGTSLRAWVRIPLVSAFTSSLQFGRPRASCRTTCGRGAAQIRPHHMLTKSAEMFILSVSWYS